MIIAMLLGVGGMVAGARSGNSNSGLANAGAAAIAGPQEMIRRTLISYQRQQEENADRAGVKFLTATGQSAKGMYETFKRFTDDSLFAARGADPYVQSHPMPAERVAALEELARSSPYWEKKDDAALQLRHDMVRAKISAFMERQDTVYRRYPMSNNSLPARYARAIATYRHGDLRVAIAQIDQLIQEQPSNPYFYELRGQALLEGGRPVEAIAPLRKAVQLSNSAPLIEMLLGQALVASNNDAYTDEAIKILRTAVARATEAPLGFSQPPTAYARTRSCEVKANELEKIVREYLIAHPEVLEEAMTELTKRQAAADAEKHEASVAKNSAAIFNSPRGVTIGNKDGDVTFVEFFDYNCGYCKRAMTDMLDLMKADPKLKVVLKEFPVLGPGSVEAAQVAVAARMQDPAGKKYLDFHQKLLGGRGQADKAHAMAAAKEAGFDMAKIEKDISSPEVRATLEENFKLAEDMGMNGTPSYVIGKQVVVGAVGLDGLKEKIGVARCGKATC